MKTDLTLVLALVAHFVSIAYSWAMTSIGRLHSERKLTGKLNTQRRRYRYVIVGQAQLAVTTTALLVFYGGPVGILDRLVAMPFGVAVSFLLGAPIVFLALSPLYAMTALDGIYRRPVSAAWEFRKTPGLYRPTICARNGENRAVEPETVTLAGIKYPFFYR